MLLKMKQLKTLTTKKSAAPTRCPSKITEGTEQGSSTPDGKVWAVLTFSLVSTNDPTENLNTFVYPRRVYPAQDD